MNTSCCPQCGNHGVALGSIVGRETVDGTFSGSGTGVGLGTGGLGLFVGGVSGTTHQATARAQALRPPERPSFNWAFVIGPIILAILVLVGAQFVPDFLRSMGDGQAAPPGTISGAADQMLSVIAPLGVIGALVMVGLTVFSSRTRYDSAQRDYTAADRADVLRRDVYQRLRYCEPDHLVFDPLTGASCPATHDNIMALISGGTNRQPVANAG
ncbi:hypothetical protein [Rhodanobacter sp. FW106-PBR-LB-2-11]|uniref:hypothetical protein n=1 Tax=Rhodanobacter sp. FW106-PBR-LB-2-11 TaxID=1524463 RepID=UPI0034E468FC